MMGFWRFGNARVGRRERDEGPSLFASSSGSEDDEDVEVESEADRADEESESLVTRPTFPDKGNSETEDELEVEYLPVAGRCSKTPSAKFISTTCWSVPSMCSMSMLRGSLCSNSTLDRSIWGRNSRTLASSSAGGSMANVLRAPESKESKARSGDCSVEELSSFNLSRIS